MQFPFVIQESNTPSNLVFSQVDPTNTNMKMNFSLNGEITEKEPTDSKTMKTKISPGGPLPISYYYCY